MASSDGASSATEKITLSFAPPLATITLCNPANLNALTADLYYRLATLLHEVARREDIYITLLTGKGRFFSAGADVKARATSGPSSSSHRQVLTTFLPNNLFVTRAFYTHPKLLVTALNGPVVGLSAALIAHSDFIYCTPATFLLTPFTSLGLVAEGGSSQAFVARMGIARANEALIMSKRLGAEELLQCGFVNKVFDAEGDVFQEQVRKEIDDRLGGHLNSDSMLKVKELIRRPGREALERAGVEEAFGGVDRFVGGWPQEEFSRIARGEKRHKL